MIYFTFSITNCNFNLVTTPTLGDRDAIDVYRKNPQLTEVPGSLRRKISIYAAMDHHPSHTYDDEEQEKFVETATRIKKQVSFF